MKFQNKAINNGLLLLVIFLLILLAGFNAYHQKLINDLSKDTDKKQEQLTEISGKLFLEETKANKVSQLKEMAMKDMEFLEKDYQELTTENKLLKKEKDTMEQKITSQGIGSCKAIGSAKCPS